MHFKFRGQRIDNKEWVYGDLQSHIDGDMNRKAISIWEDGKTVYYEVVPETVCLYTLRKDKNNKELYVKDIVKGNVYGRDNKKYPFIGVIKYINYNIMVEGIFSCTGFTFPLINVYDIEKIGDKVVDTGVIDPESPKYLFAHEE